MTKSRTQRLPAGVLILQGPEVVAPLNGTSGLYLLLCRPRSVPLADCYAGIKSIASDLGYEPEGRAEVGPACSYGVDTVTHAVWFYQSKWS